MLSEVEEAMSSGYNWVTKREPRAFHSGGISPDTILFSIQEERNGEDCIWR